MYQPVANTTFSPINTLTTTAHLDKKYSVFAQYQFTVWSTNQDFYSKLLVNDNNGHTVENCCTKTLATGFWIANLNAGHYTIEIHYKSSVAINVQAKGIGKLQYK